MPRRVFVVFDGFHACSVCVGKDLEKRSTPTLSSQAGVALPGLNVADAKFTKGKAPK